MSTLNRRVRSGRRAILDRLHSAVFWSAIVLPLVYVPMLLNGLNSRTEVSVFVGIVAVNIVLLAIARGYEIGDRR